ncbi:ATP-binding protein [Geminisphaera colitermitum]|uniref:ATP-binding protein n=1 Tax=Geminisphaera colitermitum TaxID=1148786 RepID=UPI0001964DF4|nr:ATP-binding protein [Geminisphaera colitermitum]
MIAINIQRPTSNTQRPIKKVSSPSELDVGRSTLDVRREAPRTASGRASAARETFVETPATRLIWAGLDYAVRNNSIALIEGDTGHGKTLATEAWSLARPHLAVILIEAPSIGGVRLFLSEICRAIGETGNLSLAEMRRVIRDWFAESDNRILIIDQAHDLLPRSRGAKADKIDFLRELHDFAECPIGLLCTVKLVREMSRSAYNFEQIMGRVGMPVKLPAELGEEHYRPLIVPWFPRPGPKLLAACGQVANDKLPRQKGRLRLLSQICRLANRVAAKKGETLAEHHFFKALALRDQMMGNPAHV